MKKYFLPIVVLYLLFACNNNRDTSSATGSTTPKIDSTPAAADMFRPKNDTVKTQQDNGLAIGLTQEEVTDDSVFSDGSKLSSWQNAGVRDVKGLNYS